MSSSLMRKSMSAFSAMRVGCVDLGSARNLTHALLIPMRANSNKQMEQD